MGTNAERKTRGAFFTPPDIARFLTEWAIQTLADRVLEPSAGEADFMVAAGDRLRALGAGEAVNEQLRGVEIHPQSARHALDRLHGAGYTPRIDIGSFFDVPAAPEYDAIVGNPPYIRYHEFAGAARVRALESALKAGVRLSGLASSWAPFVVHAARFLRPGGRLALVLPAELLSVKYAVEVRRYLLARFGRVRLVLFEELVFPGVQEEVVLLLAEGAGPSEHFEVFQARDLSDLQHIGGGEWRPYAPDAADKWLQALLPPASLDTYRAAFGGHGFGRLEDWGTTYLGVVTGNNGYFALSRPAAADLGIPDAELLPISPPGSRHLRALSMTDSAWEALATTGKAVYLFSPDPRRPSVAARRYIAAGEARGVHHAYKCRTRRPWWRVPLVPVADLFLTYMDRDRPRLVTNTVGARHLNSLYGVRLRGEVRTLAVELLPLAALNSLSMLGAEIVGRAYGGGLLKLEPREADRLPMPSAHLLRRTADELRALRPEVEGALREGRLGDAVGEVDRVVLGRGLGLSPREIEQVRAARDALFGRRKARSGRSHAAD